MGTKPLVAIVSILSLMAFSQDIIPDWMERLPVEDRQAYTSDLSRADAISTALSRGQAVDFKAIEALGDEFDRKWSGRDRECHARLLLQLCEPLVSGKAKDERPHDLARRLALSSLALPDQISLWLELELVGSVASRATDIFKVAGTNEFCRVRREDISVRLHAWKRMTDALDPKWDPDKPIGSLNSIMPPGDISVGGMSPESVKDPKQRAEYIAAREQRKKELKWRVEQRELRDWLERWKGDWMADIIAAYSLPPYALKELGRYLDTYLTDAETKARILADVNKNIDAQTRDTSAEVKLVEDVNQLLSRFREVCWRGDKGALKEMMSPDQVSFYLGKIASLDKSGAPCDFNMWVDNRPLVTSNNLVFASVCVSVQQAINSKEEFVKTEPRAILTLRRDGRKLMLIGTRYPMPGE